MSLRNPREACQTPSVAPDRTTSALAALCDTQKYLVYLCSPRRLQPHRCSPAPQFRGTRSYRPLQPRGGGAAPSLAAFPGSPNSSPSATTRARTATTASRVASPGKARRASEAQDTLERHMSRPEKRSVDLEATEALMKAKQSDPNLQEVKAQDGGITRAGLKVLVLLAFQNCVKNLVMRAAVSGDAHFLYSAAVIATEGTKCLSSTLYVLCTGGSPNTIYLYLRTEWRKFALLAVPAGIYNFQQTLEYVALRNLNAALFSVLVQTKLLTTAIFSAGLLGKRLRRAQLISLVLLTTGVMLAQLRPDRGEASNGESVTTGILATLGIALSSGFAAVYTEKVIKRVGTTQQTATAPPVSGLAYTQIQLAMTSLVIEGGWAFATDGAAIRERGLWDGFDYKACISVFNSAAGGLTVAAVLKYADAVLKGYATAVSVVLTGLLSMLFFGTTLSVEYALGMVNVFAAIVLYNVRDLDAHAW